MRAQLMTRIQKMSENLEISLKLTFSISSISPSYILPSLLSDSLSIMLRNIPQNQLITQKISQIKVATHKLPVNSAIIGVNALFNDEPNLLTVIFNP